MIAELPIIGKVASAMITCYQPLGRVRPDMHNQHELSTECSTTTPPRTDKLFRIVGVLFYMIKKHLKTKY